MRIVVMWLAFHQKKKFYAPKFDLHTKNITVMETVYALKMTSDNTPGMWTAHYVHKDLF